MSRQICHAAKLGFLLSVLTLEVLAASASAEPEAVEIQEATAPRNVLGLSLAVQAPLSLDKEVPLGAGLVYTRDYFVGKRTALGIHAGVRAFPDSPWHLALGYGLTIKHYAFRLQPNARRGLYLLYGLLLQMNFLEDHGGTAVGHDTLLAAGFDWQAGGVSPLVQAGYHITQVRGFDEPTLWWPYAEVILGVRF